MLLEEAFLESAQPIVDGIADAAYGADSSTMIGGSGLKPAFYARDVITVARDLIGCTVRHGETSGIIVETEAYHETEPACHAFVGLTPRTRVLFGPPGRAYVYFSYGIHALLNAVAEPAGTGAAVLIRALEPLDGIELMRARRGMDRPEDLCSGPGKLTQALGITLRHNTCDLSDGPVRLEDHGHVVTDVRYSPRIGIRVGTEKQWRATGVVK